MPSDMRVYNINTAFCEEAIKSAGLPHGTDNTIREETVRALAKMPRRSHAKFMRQMMIACTIDAPLSWWVQFDTYKVGVTRMSTSVMNVIHNPKHKFTNDSFAENMPGEVVELICNCLNRTESFRLSTEEKTDEYIKNLIPGGYIYTSFITMNYEVLRNIYDDRAKHRLGYWREFLESFTEIPHSYLIFSQ